MEKNANTDTKQRITCKVIIIYVSQQLVGHMDKNRNLVKGIREFFSSMLQE
jgi:hypothetical protein